MIKAFSKIVLCLAMMVLALPVSGQVSSVSISDERAEERDSIRNMEYPWTLPIMGKKLRDLGFELPFPNGIGVNLAFSTQDLTVSNLRVGFGDSDLINVDGLARFNEISADVQAYTARFDFWLLPFLNFYGIAGRTNSKTFVDLGLPFSLQFNTNNNGTVVGWGAVLAGGVGPLVLSANFTQAWTFIPSLDAPARSFLAGGRAGWLFRFNKPGRNLALLVGADYLRLNPESSGKADVEKLLGITPDGKQRALGELNDWYDGLSDREQQVLEPVYNGFATWLGSTQPVELKYKFNKKLFYPVSMTAGFNFQISHRYTITGIYSFLGSRDQVVIGLGYRFGFKGKNLLTGLTL